jgi:hypothetical protein
LTTFVKVPRSRWTSSFHHALPRHNNEQRIIQLFDVVDVCFRSTALKFSSSHSPPSTRRLSKDKTRSNLNNIRTFEQSILQCP